MLKTHTDISMGKTHRTRVYRSPLVIISVLIVFVAAVVFVAYHTQRIREQQAATNKLYAEVKKDVLEILTEKMKALPGDDPIIKRYGKFKRLRVQGDVTRPNYAWRLVERLSFSAVLEFEKANSQLGLGITHGPVPAITRLTMTPTVEWINEHPEGFGEFVLLDINGISNNLCMRNSNGMSVGMFDGWATHPLAP